MRQQLNRWMFALVLGLALAAQVRGADDDYTPEKIAALIKDLANEAFEKRQAAEKELVKAGMKAEKALKDAAASADPQVKLSAEKLLGRLRVMNLGAVNYLEVIPEHSIFAIQVKDVRDYSTKLAKTPFGKIVMSPAFEPARADFEKNLLNDAIFKEISGKILASVGQVGGGFWGMNIAKMEVRAAAMVEIKGDAKAAFQFFKAHMFGEQADTSTYKEVEIVESIVPGRGALALAGSHILVAPNLESLQPLIDNIVKPSGLRATADFKRAEKYGVQDPDTLVTMNAQAYLKFITTAMPFEIPGFDEMMEASGMKEMGLSVWTSKLTEDGSEERWVTTTTGKPVGYTAAMIPPKDAPPLIESMNLVPANAAAAMVYYADGAKMVPFFTQYLVGMKKMQDFTKQFGGVQGQQPDFLEMLTKGEEKVGFKMSDIMQSMKGEVAYWMTLGEQPDAMAPPDIGAFMTAVSPEKAKAVSDQMSKVYNAIAGKDIVTQAKFKERTIYNMDLNDLGANVPIELPYSLSWAVEGSRIFMASSQQALQRQLTNMDEKKPGLPTNETYTKALEALKPEEKRGALAYVDFKDLATRGALVGLVGAKQFPGLDQSLKDSLDKMPPVKEMFKDMKPIIMTADMQDDHQAFMMKSPAPITGVIAAVIAGVVGYQRKMAKIPLDQPPGGF